MSEDEVLSLGLSVAGEAGFHEGLLAGFAVLEVSEPQPPVAANFFEPLTMNRMFVAAPGTKDCSWPKTLLFSGDGT